MLQLSPLARADAPVPPVPVPGATPPVPAIPGPGAPPPVPPVPGPAAPPLPAPPVGGGADPSPITISTDLTLLRSTLASEDPLATEAPARSAAASHRTTAPSSASDSKMTTL